MGALAAAALSALIGIVPFAVGLLSYRRRQLSLLEQEARLLKDLPPGETADQLRAVVEEHVADYYRHHRGEPRKYTSEQFLIMTCGIGLAGLFALQLSDLLTARPWVVLRPSVQVAGMVAVLTSVVGVALVVVKGLCHLVVAAQGSWGIRKSRSASSSSSEDGGSTGGGAALQE